mmetsp:Transcript_21850/g.33853  ORF Transcript_21850/g.33853 Transcript_21850/m.33853 type:complete len:93 (-) Transcript_21850:2273-2551(-)
MGVNSNHGAFIQGNSNRVLDNMIQNHSINSGRARGQMNNTTLRQDGSNAGRLIIKKTISPHNEPNQPPNVNHFLNHSQNSQQSQASAQQHKA